MFIWHTIREWLSWRRLARNREFNEAVAKLKDTLANSNFDLAKVATTDLADWFNPAATTPPQKEE
jgi:hypothetical protein